MPCDLFPVFIKMRHLCLATCSLFPSKWDTCALQPILFPYFDRCCGSFVLLFTDRVTPVVIRRHVTGALWGLNLNFKCGHGNVQALVARIEFRDSRHFIDEISQAWLEACNCALWEHVITEKCRPVLPIMNVGITAILLTQLYEPGSLSRLFR